MLVISDLARNEAYLNEGVRYMVQYRENVGWDEFKEAEKKKGLDPGQSPQPLQPRKPGNSIRPGKLAAMKGGKVGGGAHGPPQKKYPQDIKHRATQAKSLPGPAAPHGVDALGWCHGPRVRRLAVCTATGRNPLAAVVC